MLNPEWVGAVEKVLPGTHKVKPTLFLPTIDNALWATCGRAGSTEITFQQVEVDCVGHPVIVQVCRGIRCAECILQHVEVHRIDDIVVAGVYVARSLRAELDAGMRSRQR